MHITKNITTGKGTMKTTTLIMIVGADEIGASLRTCFTFNFRIKDSYIHSLFLFGFASYSNVHECISNYSTRRLIPSVYPLLLMTSLLSSSGYPDQ